MKASGTLPCIVTITVQILFSGPRRIFTKRPVDPRYFVHTVNFGRDGRVGWIKVDRMANVTGRAPGLRKNLNVSSNVREIAVGQAKKGR